jgi:SAM-dependent MidA family methyltransferase
VVILGNEFIDALPVHLVDLRGEQIGEIWVSSNGGLVEEWGELSAAAARELAFLLGGEDSSEFPDEYDSEDLASLRALTVDGIIELRPAVAGLMSDIAAVMPAGSLVSIDYGEWYGEGREAEEESAGSQPPAAPGAAAPPRRSLDPSRTTRSPLLRGRTVRGYFRHQMTRDPLTRIGRQDLTADVDFSALDRHGSAAGFETVVFTNLARLLAGGGGAQELAVLRGPCGAAHPDVLEMERQAGVLAALLDEEDLGGSFKVMIQVRE